MVLTNFRAQDFKKGGDSKPAGERPAPPAPPESNEVPTGTTVEIMEWVRDDRDRARRALDAENENKHPRKTLVAQLEAMQNKETE